MFESFYYSTYPQVLLNKKCPIFLIVLLIFLFPHHLHLCSIFKDFIIPRIFFRDLYISKSILLIVNWVYFFLHLSSLFILEGFSPPIPTYLFIPSVFCLRFWFSHYPWNCQFSMIVYPLNHSILHLFSTNRISIRLTDFHFVDVILSLIRQFILSIPNFIIIFSVRFILQDFLILLHWYYSPK